jgi:hypothetical protein
MDTVWNIQTQWERANYVQKTDQPDYNVQRKRYVFVPVTNDLIFDVKLCSCHDAPNTA